MKEFHIKEDDWSFQIISTDSPRFFIRITSPRNSQLMVFSDFILGTDENDRALQALEIVNDKFLSLASPMQLIFQNVHPSYSNDNDRAELVKRHDQIVDVIKSYALRTGLKIKNSFLEPKAGKFETVVLIE